MFKWLHAQTRTLEYNTRMFQNNVGKKTGNGVCRIKGCKDCRMIKNKNKRQRTPSCTFIEVYVHVYLLSPFWDYNGTYLL